MGLVTPVSFDALATQQTKNDTSRASLAQNYEQFLRLLTTQLQNQDPLSPMDSTEFTNQLVQFSQVEQQINTNQKIDNLVALNLNNALSSAIGYVGMDISYASAEMNFDGKTPVNISYALNSPAKSNEIAITDSTGKIFYKEKGVTTTGSQKLSWDGKLTAGGKAVAGTYNVKINAFDKDGKLVKSTTVVTGRARGVESQAGVVNLLIGDRAVPLANVLNASKPASI